MTFRRSSTQKTNIPKRLLPTKKAQTAKQYYRAGIHLHISKHNIHQQDYHWASCPAQRGRISQHFHTILRFVISLMMQSQERRPPMSEAHIAASSQTALPRQAFQVQWKRGMWPMIYRTWSTHKTIITYHTPYRPPYAESPNSQALLTEKHMCKHHRITHQRHNPWASRPAHRCSIPATWWPAKAHKSASHQPWQRMGFLLPKHPLLLQNTKQFEPTNDAHRTICGDASQLKVLRNPRSRNLEMEKKR